MRTMKADITRHGRKRCRERVGISKRAVDKNAERALEYGIGHRESRGRLRHYIEYLYNAEGGNGNNIRVYADKVYVFHNDILITVLNLPTEYRRTATEQQKRQNAQ